jgi:hypothetical protein
LPVNSSPDACPSFATYRVWFTALAWDSHGPQEAFGFKLLMHFGFYLMIAALVLMGLEVLYALYQLSLFL